MATEHKTYELIVEPRESTGKGSKKLRRQELVPGVVYGHRVEAQSVQVPQRELERVYLRAGSNSLVDLKVGERAVPRKVFIHEVQRDPVSHSVQHVDFIVVNLTEEMTASVPLVIVGEAPAVDRGEGRLMQATDHVQVRALPMELPPIIEVDISGLEAVDDSIHVSDLTIPGNVTLLTSGEELVVKITELAAEEVVEEEAAAEGAEAEAGETEGEGGEGSEAGGGEQET